MTSRIIRVSVIVIGLLWGTGLGRAEVTGSTWIEKMPGGGTIQVIAADPSVEGFARELAPRTPGLIDRVSRRLSLAAPRKIIVILAETMPRTEAEMRRLGLAGVPRWAAGVAQPGRGRMVLFMDRAAGYPHRDPTGVFAHETAHLILGAHLRGSASVPRWYHEGLAMVVEREMSFEDAVQLAKMTVFRRTVPIDQLDRSWESSEPAAQNAYAQAFSFVALAEEISGPGAPARLIGAFQRGARFEAAFQIAYGLRPVSLERVWRQQLSRSYVTIPIVAAGAVVNVSFGVLALAAYIRERRRRRLILEEWDEEERWHDPGATTSSFTPDDPGREGH